MESPRGKAPHGRPVAGTAVLSEGILKILTFLHSPGIGASQAMPVQAARLPLLRDAMLRQLQSCSR
jgi:hypothetical protein